MYVLDDASSRKIATTDIILIVKCVFVLSVYQPIHLLTYSEILHTEKPMTQG